MRFHGTGNYFYINGHTENNVTPHAQIEEIYYLMSFRYCQWPSKNVDKSRSMMRGLLYKYQFLELFIHLTGFYHVVVGECGYLHYEWTKTNSTEKKESWWRWPHPSKGLVPVLPRNPLSFSSCPLMTYGSRIYWSFLEWETIHVLIYWS